MTKKERLEVISAWAKMNVLSGIVDSHFKGERFHPSGVVADEKVVILNKISEIYNILERLVISSRKKGE